jgi:hypothetical protein
MAIRTISATTGEGMDELIGWLLARGFGEP